MPLNCTCGAQLPADARFCHRCGRPQRQEDQSPPAAVEQPSAAPPPAIGFGNPAAIRVALLCGALSAFLFSIPFVSLGCCVYFPAFGFLATFLYGRRMGSTLSVRDGGRMGWLTGLMTFVVWVVDRKSTRLNSSHIQKSRMPSSA